MAHGKIYDNITDLIGNTPMVRVHHVPEEGSAEVIVKLEMFNPLSSVKDRISLAMVEDAEKRGELKPGATIVEATSGNTGIGLAFVAAAKGYKCTLVMPDTMSIERRKVLVALGAKLLLTDGAQGMNGSIRKAEEIVASGPDRYVLLQQFKNPANPEIHFKTTGPEIWNDTDGAIDVLVAGVGTGGTISGVARYLKERNPDIKIIGADPEGSVLSGGAPRPWKVEGIGEDFVPRTFNSQLVDEWIRVGDAESFHVARDLARREGILAGGSSGTNVAAALR